MNHSPIKAVGFDFGGVIGGDSNVGKEHAQAICNVLGISKVEYDKMYYSQNHLINTGEVSTWEEFWNRILTSIGKPEKLPEILEVKKATSQKYMVINQDMLKLVDALKANHYKVGLLSNATKENGIQMRAMGLEAHFDVFHISAETGLQKPDPEAFKLFANALGAKLNQLIFIDDAATSLSTATICGFTPVKYDNLPKLVDELESFGIKTT